MKPIFISLFCLLGCHKIMAQGPYERLLHKTYAQRVEQLRTIIEKYCVNAPDSLTAVNEIASFRNFAQKNNDRELVLEASLMNAYFLRNRIGETQPERVIDSFQYVIKQAEALPSRTIQARTYDLLADFLFKGRNQYEKAFEQLFLLGSLVQQIPDEELPDKLFHIYHIGEAYYFFSDYANAITYFRKALTIHPVPFNSGAIASTKNTLGLCYRNLGKLDSSDYYFKLLLDPASPGYHPVWVGIAKGNLGYNCYLRGEYDQAIPLLRADLEGAIKTSDWGLAAGSAMPLADIYFKQNRIAEAEALVMDAYEYVKRSKQYTRYEKLHPLMSKLYAAKGQHVRASLYLDSAILVKDSLSRRFNALQLLRAQQRSELQQHRLEVDKIASEKQVKTTERNLLIAFVVVLMIVALYIYQNQQRRHRQQKLLLDMELQAKEKELDLAGSQLADFAKSISEKNELIETLEQQFGENSNNEALEKLKQVTILTDEEWEKFRSLFSQVHSGYLKRLKEKLPGLTPAETRFMALAKLQLSNKEMAAVLGVSTQNIRTIWYRLRKKLGLPEEGSFEQLAESI